MADGLLLPGPTDNDASWRGAVLVSCTGACHVAPLLDVSDSAAVRAQKLEPLLPLTLAAPNLRPRRRLLLLPRRGRLYL